MKKHLYILILLFTFMFGSHTLAAERDSVQIPDFEDGPGVITVTEPVREVKLDVTDEKLNGVAGPDAERASEELGVPVVENIPEIKGEEHSDSIQSNNQSTPQNINANSVNSNHNVLTLLSIFALLILILVFILYKKKVFSTLLIKKIFSKNMSIIILFALVLSFQQTSLAEIRNNTNDVANFGYDENRSKSNAGTVFTGYSDIVTTDFSPLEEYSKSQPLIIHDSADLKKFRIYHVSGNKIYKYLVDLNKQNIVEKIIRQKRESLSGGVTTSHPTYVKFDYNGVTYERIFVGSKDGYLYCFDAQSLRGCRVNVGNTIDAAPYIYDNRYVFTGYFNPGQGNHGVAVIDLYDQFTITLNNTSQGVIKFNGLAGHVSGSGLVADDAFYFLSDDTKGYIYHIKISEVQNAFNNPSFVSANAKRVLLSNNSQAELEHGAPASISRLGNYFVFNDKTSVFYFYHPGNRILVKDTSREDPQGDRITWYSPGTALIDGVYCAVFPVNYSVNGRTGVGNGEVHVRSTTTSLWRDSDTQATKHTQPMLSAVSIIRTSGEGYLVYGDKAGYLYAVKLEKDSNTNKFNGTLVNNFFKTSSGSPTGKLSLNGSAIRSEISFGGNKIVCSTQDGRLHILVGDPINDINLDSFKITNTSATPNANVAQIKLGEQHKFNFNVNSSFAADVTPRNIDYTIKYLDVNKNPIATYAPVTKTVSTTIVPGTKEFPTGFTPRPEDIIVGPPVDSNIKFVSFSAKLQTSAEEGDYNGGNDENNILKDSRFAFDTNHGILIPAVPPPLTDLEAKNYVGQSSIISTQSTFTPSFTVVSNFPTTQTGVRIAAYIDGTQAQVRSVSIAPGNNQLSFNLNTPNIGNHSIRLGVNDIDPRSPIEMSNNYSNNLVSANFNVAQPPPPVVPVPPPITGKLDMVVSLQELTNPSSDPWVTNPVRNITSKSGYGIPLVVEIKNYDYDPQPTGGSNCANYTSINSDVRITSASVTVSSNNLPLSVFDSNMGTLELVRDTGSGGPLSLKARYVLKENPASKTNPKKRKVYTPANLSDGPSYNLTVDATVNVTYTENYVSSCPCGYYYYGCHWYYSVWSTRTVTDTITLRDTVTVRIQGSMFDDDQNVITR